MLRDFEKRGGVATQRRVEAGEFGMRQRFGCLLGALALVAITAAPSFARDLDPDEAKTLDTVVESFEVALATNDVGRLLQTLPPRMLDAMAAEFGVTVDQLVEAAREQVAQTTEEVRFESIVFESDDVHDVDATDDGLLYGKIPLSFEIILPTARFAAESEVLALRDSGEWYLLRVDSEEHWELLVRAYPSLSELTLVPETLRQLQ